MAEKEEPKAAEPTPDGGASVAEAKAEETTSAPAKSESAQDKVETSAPDKAESTAPGKTENGEEPPAGEKKADGAGDGEKAEPDAPAATASASKRPRETGSNVDAARNLMQRQLQAVKKQKAPVGPAAEASRATAKRLGLPLQDSQDRAAKMLKGPGGTPVILKKVTEDAPAVRQAGPLLLRPKAGGLRAFADTAGHEEEEEEEPEENGRENFRARAQLSRRVGSENGPEVPIRGLAGNFGVMLGHLSSAKKSLVEESGTAPRLRRPEPKFKIRRREDVAPQGGVSLRPARAAQLSAASAAKSKPQEKASTPANASHRKAMRRLIATLEEQYTHMKGFIRTAAEPSIFYLPQDHNEKTQRLLEKTQQAITTKIQNLKTELGGDDDDDDDDDSDEDEEEEEEEEDAQQDVEEVGSSSASADEEDDDDDDEDSEESEPPKAKKPAAKAASKAAKPAAAKK